MFGLLDALDDMIKSNQMKYIYTYILGRMCLSNDKMLKMAMLLVEGAPQ